MPPIRSQTYPSLLACHPTIDIQPPINLGGSVTPSPTATLCQFNAKELGDESLQVDDWVLLQRFGNKGYRNNKAKLNIRHDIHS